MLTGWPFVAVFAGIFLAVVITVRTIAAVIDRHSRGGSARQRTRDKDASHG